MARTATAKINPGPAEAALHSHKAAGPAGGERNCSVARTLDIVSDAWAFLIIREAFFGTRTFEAFRSALDIPRATLTDRLRKLTRLQIFRQVAVDTGQRTGDGAHRADLGDRRRCSGQNAVEPREPMVLV